MKKYIVLLLLLLAITSQAQTIDYFVGEWRTDTGTVVEIYKQEAAYYAKIKNGSTTTDRVVLVQMVKRSANLLYGGTYYDAGLQSEYEAKLKLTDNNTIRLKMFVGVFTKTMVWRRMPSETAEGLAVQPSK